MHFLGFCNYQWYVQVIGGSGRIGSGQSEEVRDSVMVLVLVVAGGSFVEVFGRPWIMGG